MQSILKWKTKKKKKNRKKYIQVFPRGKTVSHGRSNKARKLRSRINLLFSLPGKNFNYDSYRFSSVYFSISPRPPFARIKYIHPPSCIYKRSILVQTWNSRLHVSRGKINAAGKIRGQRGGEMKIFTISFAIYIYIIYTHIYIGLIERADFSRFRSIFKHAHCHSREESSPRQDLRFSCLSRAHGPSNLASFQKSFHPPFFVCSSRINLDINEN